MKKNNTLKLMKKLLCFLAIAACLNSGKSSAQYSENSQTFSKNDSAQNQPKKATPYSKEEIEKMVKESFEQLEPLIKKSKHIFIAGAGGGWGLADPFLYSLKDENEKRKMNDAAYVLMYAIPKYLDSDITVLFVNGADNTIKIISKDDSKNIQNILPNIPANAECKYDKYYSGENQMWAVRCLTEKIAEVKNSVASWQEIIDPITDDPVVDKKTGKPMFKANKLGFAPKTLAHMSLQTNSNANHNGEGMELYFNANDMEGKLLSEKIAENNKNLFATKIKNSNPVFATTTKTITQLGEFGVPTTINFFDHTDNKENQHKFFDSDAVERAAMNIAKGINSFFNIDINFANIELEPVHDENHYPKYVKIKITIQGFDIDSIKKCSIAVLDADKSEELSHPENFRKPLKIEESNGGSQVTAEFKFVPKFNIPNSEELKANGVDLRKIHYCDTRRNIHNKFYIKLWQEKNNGELVLIPSNVTNFALSQHNPFDEKYKNLPKHFIEAIPNSVYRKDIDETRKLFPEFY